MVVSVLMNDICLTRSRINVLVVFAFRGFLQAHVSYLDEECQTCLLLLSVDIEAFYILSDCKSRIKEVHICCHVVS